MAAWVKIIIYFTLCMQLRAYWKYIPISYDTTRLTSPVKQDGSIDYLAALNIKCSQGVTPENNAVVVLLRAAGSDYINGPPDYKKEYMNMLGVMSLPSPKHPFVYLYDYLSKHGFQWQDVDHIYGEVTRKPFTDSQYPQVGHWLDSQQDFIKVYHIVEAHGRFEAARTAFEDFECVPRAGTGVSIRDYRLFCGILSFFSNYI